MYNEAMTGNVMQNKATLGFFTNPKSDSAVKGLRAALDHALSLGYQCCLDPAITALRDYKLPSSYERRPDYIIAFGGDGTILHAAEIASEIDAPILGVNLGRVGFLSEITEDGFDEALSRLDAKDYALDSRMMLECRVDEGKRRVCLNEALLYKRSFSGVVDISMEIDGISAGSVLCDGLIISTSTGATGYSISAGGPVIAPGLDVMIITPVCPHTLYVRPIIASKDSRLSFSMNSEGYISLDGIYTSKINKDDRIDIGRARTHVDFIRFNRQNLYSLIRDKLS